MHDRRRFIKSVTAAGFAFGCCSTGRTQEKEVARCGYDPTDIEGGFRLTGGWLNPGPFSTSRSMNFAIDRTSFLDRGWSESDIGTFDPRNKRKSLLLSAFYALQMNNPHDIDHPWNEKSDGWDRGLSAHIDYWCNSVTGKTFEIYVYESIESAPHVTGTIVGRRSTETPFKERGRGVIGVAPGRRGEIWINTDARFAFGERMDVNSWVPSAGFRINLSQLLAHEAGHWFGFAHNDTTDRGIMYPSIGGDFPPRWQLPEGPMQEIFRQLATKLKT